MWVLRISRSIPIYGSRLWCAFAQGENLDRKGERRASAAAAEKEEEADTAEEGGGGFGDDG